MDKQTFCSSYPEAYFLECDARSIEDYLLQQQYLLSGETISHVEKAGDGNMNCTLRVKSDKRSFIVKQSRPWVEKYPSIAAPIERTLMEAEFYSNVQRNDLVLRDMPRLLHVDENSYIVVFEDLGNAKDFTFLYNGEFITGDQLQQLTIFLGNLHTTKTTTMITNEAMRALNYQHIYEIPLKDKSVDLDNITPGLNDVASEFRNKNDYKKCIATLGKLYLENGTTLLHGDYYPGSWLLTDDGVKIIDVEFCFCGPAEFDMGVMIAHLLLAKQPRSFVFKIFAHYRRMNTFDVRLAFQFAGVEIMRRLLGVAQLPIKYHLQDKRKLLELSYRLVVTPDNTLSEVD
ncbi:phosphotransferase [Candidatus Uabimicrobium amorphum]|uniref:Methylthioribose kinase n=1 Tax=Uabimicrobium amorphum TaxID=2596890 RepID=A0A5S9IQ48_UABAM|nr:phosphotransferase [Candidatus Uabimicrobium amorphum]BBM86028.1 methylthioribose kinase [Candidatus Uabimicrobium amorphum]